MFVSTLVQAKKSLINIKNAIDPFIKKIEKTERKDRYFSEKGDIKLSQKKSDVVSNKGNRKNIDKSVQTTHETSIIDGDPCKPSDILQIFWMKKVIDDLCEDNLVLKQSLDDSKRVIELIVCKLKVLRKASSEFNSWGEIKKRYESMLSEKKVNICIVLIFKFSMCFK
jgi:hypothetical protein